MAWQKLSFWPLVCEIWCSVKTKELGKKFIRNQESPGGKPFWDSPTFEHLQETNIILIWQDRTPRTLRANTLCRWETFEFVSSLNTRTVESFLRRRLVVPIAFSWCWNSWWLNSAVSALQTCYETFTWKRLVALISESMEFRSVSAWSTWHLWLVAVFCLQEDEFEFLMSLPSRGS